MQPTVVVGADWTLHPWRHKSSNAEDVTAGQAGQNSSCDNSVINVKTGSKLVYGIE